MGVAQGIKATTPGANLVATTAADFSGANWLGALIVIPTSITLSSIVDSTGSNTWLAHPDGVPKTATATAARAYVYTVTNPVVSATQTFQANFSGVDIGLLVVIGLSGRNTSSPIDAHAYAGDASAVTSHVGGATGALPGSGDDVLGFFFDDNGTGAGQNTTYTQGTGWTLTATFFNSDGRSAMTGGIEYQTNVGSGTNVTIGWTSGVATTGGGFILAVKGGSSNTAVTPTAGSTSTTGNQPTVTKGTNTVLTPAVARHDGGLLVPDRRIVLPRARKIFIPSRKAA
jgi:hypothetical protein